MSEKENIKKSEKLVRLIELLCELGFKIIDFRVSEEIWIEGLKRTGLVDVFNLVDVSELVKSLKLNYCKIVIYEDGGIGIEIGDRNG